MPTPPALPVEPVRKKSRLPLAVRLLLLAVGLYVIYAGIQQTRRGWPQATSAATEKWERHTVGEISLELPGVLTDEKLAMTPQMAEHAERIEKFSAQGNRRLISLTHVVYKPAAHVQLQSESEGAQGLLKSMPGVTDITFASTDTEVAGLPAKTLTANYKIKGAAEGWRMVFFSRGQKLWIVTVAGVPGDIEKDADRVQASLQMVP